MSHFRCLDNPGSPLRKAIENGQEGPGCAGYNCRLNGDQEGPEKDEYALKIDIRQGEVPEVIPKEENAEGSEDSTQAGSIDKPSDAQEAEVSGVVRSVVFTTERAREITATTTEEVDATSKPINVTFTKLIVGDQCLYIVYILFIYCTSLFPPRWFFAKSLS